MEMIQDDGRTVVCPECYAYNRLEGPVVEGKDREFLFRVIRAGFGERRKMLKNALSRSGKLQIPRPALDEALRVAEIDGNRRAETLDLDEFVLLSETLHSFMNE